MKIENYNYKHLNQKRNYIDFKAKFLSYANINSKEKIELYSLNKTDLNFLNKFFSVLKNTKLNEDNLAIKNTNLNANIIDSLKKTITESQNIKENGIILAIKNSRNIIGIAEYIKKADININLLHLFRNDLQNVVRKSLILQILKNISKQKDFALCINSENLNDKSKNFYSKLGFKKDKIFKSKDIFIDNENIDKTIEKLKNDIKLISNKLTTKEHDLINMLEI